MARTAEVKRDARIGEAEAKRDAQVMNMKIDIRPKDTFFLCLEEKIDIVLVKCKEIKFCAVIYSARAFDFKNVILDLTHSHKND